ncbi:MAG: hypothetical protein LCH84_06550 [Gemmatimonadetes bacterium]|nr:hypothetical protein [Gemmatimonadota bacterium]
MRLSLTSSKASNWVDRGGSPLPMLEQSIAHFFEWHDAACVEKREQAARDVLGMVHADATDVQIVGLLRHLARAEGRELPPKARITAIALWHIAKAALVRDAATRLLNSGLADQPEPGPLSARLAARLQALDDDA